MSRWLVAIAVLAAVSPSNAVAQAGSATRTTLVIRYQEGRTTDILMDGTPASPRVRGKASVEAKRGSAMAEIELEGLGPAASLGPYYAAYVLWGITPEGRTTNLGEIPWKGDAKLRANMPVQRFALIVTAEPYGAVSRPSPKVVAENRLKQGESVASTGEISYTGDDGRFYTAEAETETTIDPKTPAPVAAARLAVRVARRADADTYARGELTQATEKLAQMEAAFAKKPKNEGDWGSFAREAARLAHAARTNAAERRAQVALVEERQAQTTALEKAKAEADAAAAAARSERLAAERAMAEQRAAAVAAEDATRRAESAKAEAAAAQQQATTATAEARSAAEQAAQAKQEAEQAREAQRAAYDEAAAAMREAQAASRERDEIRKQLETSLNAVLDTRREARGLVVNLGDVLFDFGQSTLRVEAREKLSRLAGVLLAYPGAYTLAFDGHTDAVGSDEANLKLSQSRAEVVRDYLVGAGVKGDRVAATRGLGKSQPVASNDTDEGRRRNRRVEIIVNDQAKAGS